MGAPPIGTEREVSAVWTARQGATSSSGMTRTELADFWCGLRQTKAAGTPASELTTAMKAQRGWSPASCAWLVFWNFVVSVCCQATLLMHIAHCNIGNRGLARNRVSRPSSVLGMAIWDSDPYTCISRRLSNRRLTFRMKL